MGTQLLVLDLAALFLAGAITITIWARVNPALKPESYLSLIPLLLVFSAAYALTGLYPAIGISPVDEFRRLTITTTMVFLVLATISFWVRNVEVYSRASFGITWILALIFLPIFRELYRSIRAKAGHWGEPVTLIGYGATGQTILEYLLNNPKFGIIPRWVICDEKDETFLPTGVERLSLNAMINGQPWPQLEGIRTAIIITPQLGSHDFQAIAENQTLGFTHLIMMSDILPIGSVWVTPYDVGGLLGLEIRQNLLSPEQQTLKRMLDLGLILLFSPLLIPLYLLLALLVIIDSPGGVLYTHTRIGQHNRCVRVWKFRSMVQNADQVLEKYLLDHPEQKAEWEATRKLKNDPRITRIGAFYRKLSLDEIPQLWNVLKGEMSLVGPRPIVTAEIAYYANSFTLYTQVKPGMTGMWQISGRNNLSYAERVRLDSYYVRNWSIWLDIYILIRTIFTVLSGKGAY